MHTERTNKNIKLLLASTSTVYGSNYLEYLMPELEEFFKDIKQLIFIPFARPAGISHEAYSSLVSRTLTKIGIDVLGLHSCEDPQKALSEAEAIFVGGGNTFVLVHQLYALGLMDSLRQSVLSGSKYLGTSAGSNIAGVSMQTTNDMPILSVPSYATCAWIPFNINPHYLDPNPQSRHKGETRQTRIKEFHVYNQTPVLGLREGSWLRVTGDQIRLCGPHSARLFRKNQEPQEIPPTQLLSFSPNT